MWMCVSVCVFREKSANLKIKGFGLFLSWLDNSTPFLLLFILLTETRGGGGRYVDVVDQTTIQVHLFHILFISHCTVLLFEEHRGCKSAGQCQNRKFPSRNF